MAFFYYLVGEVVTYFNFCIFPKFIIDFFIGIPKIKFNALELSSIKNAVSCYFDYNKIKLTNFESNNFFSKNELNKGDLKVNTFLMKNTINDSNPVNKNIDKGEGSSNNNRGNKNQSNFSYGENNESGELSSTSYELTPKRREGGILVLSGERPNFNQSTKPIYDPFNALRQTSSNSLLSTIPGTPKVPNPYERLPTPDMNFNNMRFPSFSDLGSNITPSEIETPINSINVSETNLSGTNTNYTNHGTYGSLSSDFSTNYTNDTNHGTLGTNEYGYVVPIPNASDFDYRRQQITSNFRRQVFENAMNNTTGDVTTMEMDVHKDGIRGKVKLGLNYLGSKIQHEISKLDSIYIKYHDVSKRHFY